MVLVRGQIGHVRLGVKSKAAEVDSLLSAICELSPNHNNALISKGDNSYTTFWWYCPYSRDVEIHDCGVGLISLALLSSLS
jgi:hypothetical protein